MCCTIWYHLYNLKNVKNIHGRVLFSVKLEAEHAFCISNTFISNARLKLAKKIKQMLSNTLRLNFCYLKYIHILHPRYHPKIIVHILKNKEKNKCVCIHEIIRWIIMKMKTKMKNTSNRYDINRPRHGYKYSKQKVSQ